ncbi:hypothetical protein SDC9_162477 [bioreactor metagenome]|uniref:ICEBs1 excisionase n=1 Tax=bioreactor metagenome TaxID=1076179 RepID=A0A645FL62_9ZZZZ
MAKTMMNVKEVQEKLEISESKAYEVIRNLNAELEAKGYLVITGKCNRRYFNEKFYGYADDQEG